MIKYYNHFLIYYTLFIISITSSNAQINVNNIEIIRDNYGVPHIFSKTDAELAYGLAWVNAEDDFETIQKAYLEGNNLLSKLLGIKGAGADFLTQFIGSDELINDLYESKISIEYKKILEAYSQGINRFAELNPDKVLIKELFPLNPKKLLKYASKVSSAHAFDAEYKSSPPKISFSK